VRPYLVGGERRLLRECCDWWAAPHHRASGLGLRMMRRLMQSAEPIIAVGGSSMTLELLPRMGWHKLGDAEAWVLPLKVRYFAAAVLRRSGREHLARVLPRFLPLAHVPAAAAPAGTTDTRAWRPADGALQVLPGERCVSALVEEADVRWLASAPTCLMHVECNTYSIDHEPAGFAISQIEVVPDGKEGKILHVQVADERTPVLQWMINDAVGRLSLHGAGIVRARSGTPAMSAALRRAGFRVVRKEPVYWWGSDPPPPNTPLRLSYIRADDAVPFESARG
jgi:hypothetical protein